MSSTTIGAALADAATICLWMEARPSLPDCYQHMMHSPQGWWRLGPIPAGGMLWYPRLLDLDALCEVEATLMPRLWEHYIDKMVEEDAISGDALSAALLHATPAQKIAALAAVIRTENEREKSGRSE